uniref:Transmembrane protein n=1 Tax=Ascaris lumbricoides TaxID=6252 RepID=A0A0M3HMZ9_ASCLU
MEHPARMQDVLPIFSERGVDRIVAEKKMNPRSIPFRDDEFSQWYCVGKMKRGGFWRPYKVTVIVLECVLMTVSSLFFAYTLFYANIETDSVLGYFIMHRNLVAQQNTDAAAIVVHAFDVHFTYPYIWFTWLLLPAGISSIIFPLLTIILLSGQERGCFKWIAFSMHAFSVFALLPLGIDVITLELDLNTPGTYSFLQPDFNKEIHVKEEAEFLRSWTWYVSFHERRFMHFNSDETLIRSLEAFSADVMRY